MTEHVIFEQYTDMDKNINILANVKAECIHARKYNLCYSNCASCLRAYKFQECYKQLALCDQLRLDSNAEYIAAQMELTRTYVITRKKQIIQIRTIVIIVALLFILFVCTKAYSQSLYTNYYTEDKWIVDTLNRTHSQVKDVNHDGVVNCIDYTITYKRLWDLQYPTDCCEIVRNYNVHTEWHHLFISVRGTNKAKWIFIEPQGTQFNYRMTDYWKDKYDPTYNIFYETKMWLERGTL